MALVIKTTGWEDYMDPAGGSWIKMLVMGNPDVGKTRSASFWPRPIFADCEDGRMSLADRKVPYGRIRSTADMDGLLTQLEFDNKRPAEKRRYTTLVLDTIDKFQKLVINEKLAREGKDRLTGWADWGWLDGYMQTFVHRVLNLEMNVVANVHYKTLTSDDDDDDTAKVVGQALRLKGDVKEWLIEEFDLIGMMESYYSAEAGQRTRKRRIRWHNEPSFPLLKDRSGSLPQFTDIDFTEGDYQRVFDALMSHVDDLPESTDVEEIATEEPVAPVDPAEVKGGPVEPGTLPTKKAPAKKAAVKKAAKPVPAPGATEVTVKPIKEPSGVADDASSPASPEPASTPTDVPTTEEAAEPAPAEPAATPAEPSKNTSTAEAATDDGEAAVQMVQEQLGGQAVDESELPDKYCGKQPTSHTAYPAVPGCGKDLKDENLAKVNLALLRAKTMLCPACFETWKSSKAS